MKKALFIIATFFSLAGDAQVASTGTTDYAIMGPGAYQRVRQGDSVQVYATIYVPVKVATLTVTQTAGPAVKIAPVAAWYTNNVETLSFWVSTASPGGYSWKFNGSSTGGSTSVTTDSLTILPPMTPRIATSLQVSIDGQLTTIPIAGSIIGYGDGTIQQN